MVMVPVPYREGQAYPAGQFMHMAFGPPSEYCPRLHLVPGVQGSIQANPGLQISEGRLVGCLLGCLEGWPDGRDGKLVGCRDGCSVGCCDG